jgi:pilus assembly protein Flp/PilA
MGTVAISVIDSLRNRSEAGQGLVEYALILVLIAIVSIAILSTLGNSVSSVFSQANVAL